MGRRLSHARVTRLMISRRPLCSAAERRWCPFCGYLVVKGTCSRGHLS